MLKNDSIALQLRVGPAAASARKPCNSEQHEWNWLWIHTHTHAARFWFTTMGKSVPQLPAMLRNGWDSFRYGIIFIAKVGGNTVCYKRTSQTHTCNRCRRYRSYRSSRTVVAELRFFGGCCFKPAWRIFVLDMHKCSPSNHSKVQFLFRFCLEIVYDDKLCATRRWVIWTLWSVERAREFVAQCWLAEGVSSDSRRNTRTFRCPF